MRLFRETGEYLMLMKKVFSKPEKFSIYRRRTLFEMEAIGLNSIGIVAIISIFIGAVVVIQMANNFEDPFIPKMLIGYATRETVVLEFSSTIVALILAGKVGSNIASEIGTMRITEQIDALEIMGVNSAGFLILPKVVAAALFFPLLTIMSMVIGVVGGYLTVIATQIFAPFEYINGIRLDFEPFYITYSITKTCLFGIIISTVAGYYGYYAKGNSLEVGRSSTRAVVMSSIIILIFNLILTQIMLT